MIAEARLAARNPAAWLARRVFSGRVRLRWRLRDTARSAAVKALLRLVLRWAARCSTTTLGTRLRTTLIRHRISTPPRGPLTSRTRTVTRSTAREYRANSLPRRRRIWARSSSFSRTPSILIFARVRGAALRSTRRAVVAVIFYESSAYGWPTRGGPAAESRRRMRRRSC